MTDLTEAVKILKQGGIVIYPTDTAFGIGCRIDNKKSIQKLFRLRKRPQSRATPVLVDSIRMAEKYFISPLPDGSIGHMNQLIGFIFFINFTNSLKFVMFFL